MSRDPWLLFRKKDEVLRKALDGIALATSPDVIADVGCFNGNEIARFHALCPQAACHAFEANEHNIASYISPRADVAGITINYLAVADYDGEIEFNIVEPEGGEEDWRRGAGSLNKRTDDLATTTVKVPCTRLDTYFQHEILENRTFLLWIDVEGALDRVIAGAEQVLKRTIVLRAELERHAFWQDQKLANEILDRFRSLGFIALGDTYTPDAWQQSDVILLNQNWLGLASGDEDAWQA